MRDDGLPTLPTGEPVLQRWFVLAMIVLVPVAIAVTVWGFLSIDRDELSAAERRPAGDGEVTIERGQADVADTRDADPGPGCAQGIRLIGDPGSQAAARRATEGVCELIATGDFPEVRAGLVEWLAAQGQVRIATFELAGVESSARVDDDRIMIELNAKFQFEDAVAATPALVHQLVLLTDPDWPGRTVAVETELAAVRAQHEACRQLGFDAEDEGSPRGCRDVVALLEEPDPRAALLEVGFRG